MKFLISGATAFAGAWLAKLLVNEGHEVFATSRRTNGSEIDILDIMERSEFDAINWLFCDLQNKASCFDVMRSNKYDGIFHLAAQSHPPTSFELPFYTQDVNIKGTLNVLQAARLLNTKRILVTSTSEVYGTAQFVPITEKHPFQGQSPYSATKIGADRLAESFYRSFNLPITIVRPFNTYGPRQSARAVIPTIITQLMDGNNKIKLGYLSPTRDFIYVKDTVNGFIEIAKYDKTIGQEINIATQSEISIENLAEELIRQINPKAKIICDEQRIRPEKSEVNRLFGSNKKLKTLTNWTQKYSLEEGLIETIDWFSRKENLARYKAGIYNL